MHTHARTLSRIPNSAMVLTYNSSSLYSDTLIFLERALSQHAHAHRQTARKDHYTKLLYSFMLKTIAPRPPSPLPRPLSSNRRTLRTLRENETPSPPPPPPPEEREHFTAYIHTYTREQGHTIPHSRTRSSQRGIGFSGGGGVFRQRAVRYIMWVTEWNVTIFANATVRVCVMLGSVCV